MATNEEKNIDIELISSLIDQSDEKYQSTPKKNNKELTHFITCEIDRIWNINQNDETFCVEFTLNFFKSLSNQKSQAFLQNWSHSFSIKNCFNERIHEYPLKLERIRQLTNPNAAQPHNQQNVPAHTSKEQRESLYEIQASSLRKESVAAATLFARKKYKVETVISQDFDVGNFPFDVQDLTIAFGSIDGRDDNINITKYIPMDHIENNLFSVSPQCFQSDEWILKRSLIEFRSNFVVIRLKYRRNHWIYILNYCLIIDFITGLSLAQFSLNADKKEERLAILITLILTSVAFNEQKPKTKNTITIIDIFVFVNYLFLMVMLIESALLIDDAAVDNGFINNEMDLFLFYVSFGIFIVYNILFVISSFIKYNKEEKKLNQRTEDFEREIQANNYKMSVNLQNSYAKGTDETRGKMVRLLKDKLDEYDGNVHIFVANLEWFPN